MVDARLMDYELGKLAAERGSQLGIRAYGQRMVLDQPPLLEQLNRLATASRVTVPVIIGADKREDYKELLTLESESFDTAFIASMRKAHRRDVSRFKQAMLLPDPAVAAFAAAKLPVIESHLQGIENIEPAH